ncbi:radical SAM/SPASM domain-containing protein [Arenicellales bacterium nBUS_48]
MTSEKQPIVRPRIYSAEKQPLQEILPLQTPISAHVDPSSLCNYKCSFCFQADTKGMKEVGLKRGWMDIQLFKKIIDDFKEFPDPIKKIKIGNHGEPTLHPDLVEMVDYARTSNTAEIIEMFTNGSKLEPKLNEGLVRAGLQRINISLEGLSDQRYLEVAGIKQNFNAIIDGVRSLHEIKVRENSELQIYVKIADQAHALKGGKDTKFYLTDEEKKFFFDTFTPICDEIFVEKIVPQWADTQLEKQNDLEDTGMYGQKIGKWKDSCPFIFMYMHFNCDGTVSPCTLDWPRKVVVGNAKNESVKDIWGGKALRELQVAMLAGQRKCINLCNNCSAPMVCVEEDLDAHVDKVVKAIGGEEDYSNLKGNRWITEKNDPSDVTANQV